MVAPMFGAAIAAPVYWFMIEGNHPDEQDANVQVTREDQPQYET